MPEEKSVPGEDEAAEDTIEIIYEDDPGDATTGLEPVLEGEEETVAEDSQSTVERLEGEIEHIRDLYLRKLAEFDNFRKRTERERDELQRTASENLVRELIPVLDNFERALQHTESSDPNAFQLGVEMISRQLWDVLGRQGLQAMDPVGRLFEPEFHDAVQRVEDSGCEPGTVVAVLAKGFLFSGRLVRPAIVSVAVSPSDSDSKPPDVDEEVAT